METTSERFAFLFFVLSNVSCLQKELSLVLPPSLTLSVLAALVCLVHAQLGR